MSAADRARKRAKVIYKEDPAARVRAATSHQQQLQTPLESGSIGSACKPLLAGFCSVQAAELEEFLFGATKTDVKEVFARRVEESDDDDATLTDLVHKVWKGMGGLNHGPSCSNVDNHSTPNT
jgi:hypothetical protein